jgi:hypothetical protein
MTSFIDQGLDREASERDALAHLPNTLRRAACLFAIHPGPRLNQPCDGLAAPRDHNLLALLDPIEQRAEPVLGFECTDFLHESPIS